MRRLVLFLGSIAALLGAAATFNWWVDPFGDIYKPGALTAAMQQRPNCLVSQELVGARYFSFKLDVFHRRPTRRFVVGSSRVLKIESRPGEQSFSNLGFPGTAPETILALFGALPAKPAQTVYVGVDPFWFNPSYAVPVYRPTAYDIAQLPLEPRDVPVRLPRSCGRATSSSRTAGGETRLEGACVIGRIFPSIAWKVDGSRVWSWELDPEGVRAVPAAGVLDRPRDVSERLLRRTGRRSTSGGCAFSSRRSQLARQRGWRVVGFAPPEPPDYFRLLRADPQLAARWHEFLQEVMPALFARQGFAGPGSGTGVRTAARAADFPDGFHTDAACSARVRARLDAARIAGRVGRDPYACSHGRSRHRRPSRPRRVLRGGRGAREPRAARAAADRRRRPAGARRRRDGELRRTAVRHPFGDERRRGDPALPARGLRASAPRALPGVLAPRLVDGARDRPDRRADRDRRGISRPRRGRARLPRGAGHRRGGADGGPRRDEPDVLARRRSVQGRREGRQRRAQARRSHRRRAGAGGVVPRRPRRPPAARRRAEGAGAAARSRRRDRGRARRSRRRRAAAAAAGQRRRGASRPCARHRSARARPRRRSGSRSASRTRSSAISAIPSVCTTSCAGWRPRSPGTCRRRARSRGR